MKGRRDLAGVGGELTGLKDTFSGDALAFGAERKALEGSSVNQLKDHLRSRSGRVFEHSIFAICDSIECREADRAM